MIDAVKRFFVRLWYLNRNQMIEKTLKIISKTMVKRRALFESIPDRYRSSAVANDSFSALVISLKHQIDIYLGAIGYVE